MLCIPDAAEFALGKKIDEQHDCDWRGICRRNAAIHDLE
jgi:hypothetical protein